MKCEYCNEPVRFPYLFRDKLTNKIGTDGLLETERTVVCLKCANDMGVRYEGE